MPCCSITAWRFWRKSSWIDSNLTTVNGMCSVNGDTRALLIQLARHQLVRNHMFCTRCPGMRRMHLYATKTNNEGYFWRCRQCRSFSSVRKGSFFKNTKVTLAGCLWLIKHWANRLTARASAADLGVSRKTVINFRKQIRNACYSVNYLMVRNFPFAGKQNDQSSPRRTHQVHQYEVHCGNR